MSCQTKPVPLLPSFSLQLIKPGEKTIEKGFIRLLKDMHVVVGDAGGFKCEVSCEAAPCDAYIPTTHTATRYYY